ncbi:hypothetical protein F4W66_25150 (plasmid) [Escherichia coli]|nr:hypothetical protein F4W66_25150 [Escherichia coli]
MAEISPSILHAFRIALAIVSETYRRVSPMISAVRALSPARSHRNRLPASTVTRPDSTAASPGIKPVRPIYYRKSAIEETAPQTSGMHDSSAIYRHCRRSSQPENIASARYAENRLITHRFIDRHIPFITGTMFGEHQ